MDEQQIEQLILEIKRFFIREGVTFVKVTLIKEVSDNQYFEAVDGNGTIRELRYSYGKLFVRTDGQWMILDILIELKP